MGKPRRLPDTPAPVPLQPTHIKTDSGVHPLTHTTCSVCGLPQFRTRSGVTCANDHRDTTTFNPVDHHREGGR